MSRPLRRPAPVPFTVDLPVDAFVADISQYTRIGGPEPLLDSDDDDTSYIHTAASNITDKYYTYEDLAFTPETITTVVLVIKQRFKTWSSDLIRYFLWHDGAWDYVYYVYATTQLAWGYTLVDVTSKLDSVVDINAARFYLDTFQLSGDFFSDVTYSCIRVSGTRYL